MQKRIQRALCLLGGLIILTSCQFELNYNECPQGKELREFMSQIDNTNITSEQQEIIDEITARYELCKDQQSFN